MKFFIVKFILFIGQRSFIGRGQIRKTLVNLINFLIPSNDSLEMRFICYIKNVPFNFYNDNLTGIKVYFGRNEVKEINFIKNNSPDKSVFIDIGSNMGLYTQNIAFLNSLNREIKIISIEPNPINVDRLKKNIALLKSKIKNINNLVKVVQCAVGKDNYKKKLDFSNGLANGYIPSNKSINNTIRVNCKKLYDIIKEENIKYITNLKIDIEGYEDRALIPFFNTAKKSLFPKNILLEHSSSKFWEKDLIKFLIKKGYKVVFKNKSNLALTLN
jgi:FkbM family methyltransferase